ncbi:MAG: hypothetical protein CR994_07190 [Maribacter sp.]|nr:MAG: hypothetical protein CR994_07190 [Maribacter sp.]
MIKNKLIFTILILLICKSIFGQTKPEINIKFSKLYATYEFVQKLSSKYPDNLYKKTFYESKYNTEKYNGLIKRFDTLKIYETYEFQGYPVEQKIPGITTNFIKKNLISNQDLKDFKKQTFGIVPGSELLGFCEILESFEPVYDELIYLKNKYKFSEKVEQLSKYITSSHTAGFFQSGLDFYGTEWDFSIPFEIAIVPSLSQRGFTATTFLNIAVSEMQLDFESYDVLLSVLMHEIYHILYDEQPLETKLNLKKWFNENDSKNSQYAFLLLNEVLATALGNGFVFEQLKGKLDEEDWYYNKYINEMAKKIYPTVKQYLTEKRVLDKDFVDKYISIYDRDFQQWRNELDNILTYRYIIADNPKHFDFFLKNYPRTSVSYMNDELTPQGLERMKERPLTKIVLVSNENPEKLKMVKDVFPELKNWSYDPNREFVHIENLNDKTKLIIVNAIEQETFRLLEKTFENRKIE